VAELHVHAEVSYGDNPWQRTIAQVWLVGEWELRSIPDEDLDDGFHDYVVWWEPVDGRSEGLCRSPQ
jgi:hypothetical protein